jgi:uncharacterized phage protein gp47/JayE
MFLIPTLQQSLQRARASFRTYLAGTDAWLWPNNVYPTAKVLGELQQELFGFADSIQRQKFAITADDDNLDLHGAEIGLGRLPPQPSQGPTILTFADAVTVATGAVLQRGDGVQFAATAGGAAIGAGTLTVPVRSLTPGLNTVTAEGAPLTIISGVTDVHGDAKVTAVAGIGGLIGGDDVEKDGAYFTPPPGTYRYRILFKKRNPPHGGAASDYVLWCGEVAGVTRVFVERRWLGAGTVRVFVLMDNLYANGIPLAGDIARVQAFVDTLAPAGADVTIAAPIANPINISISGMVPNNPTVQNAVLAELAAAFLRLSKVVGSDKPNVAMPFLATAGSFSRSWIWQAVANATGEERHVVISPPADVPLAAGQIATLGNVSFIA